MKFKPKKEEVSVSFHRLLRSREFNDRDNAIVPIRPDEFDAIHQTLLWAQSLDLGDEEVSRKVQLRYLAQIETVEKFDGRYIAGIYRAAYSGHAYDNTVVGKIPAESINLRPFFFLLYLSDSGHIYVASQYLGTFGGYTAIKNTIASALSEPNEIVAVSLHNGNAALQGAKAKQIEISFSKKADSITSKNSFGKFGAISFKKQWKDDGFEEDVSRTIFSHAHKNPNDIKTALADLLRSNEIMEISDDDVENCTVIAVVNGKRKTIHMLDESNWATRYPINVPLNLDGHPFYAPLKASTLELLKHHISVMEDV